MSLLPDLLWVRRGVVREAVAVSPRRHCASGPIGSLDGEQMLRVGLGARPPEDKTGETCQLVT